MTEGAFDARQAGVPAWGLLAVGIVAVSTSGPLIASIAAPALAVAFWRNALASAVLVPVAAARRRDELAGLSRRAVGGCVLAGVMLTAHFATWVPSVTMTSVATSTALVCALPVWTALFAVAAGRRVGAVAWTGVLLAVAGTVLTTGADLGVSSRALTGDALAVAGGFFAAAYVTIGERVRATVSTTVYTTICYTVCALLLLAACLAAGADLTGYPAASWWLLAALTVGPQFLGHSVLNRVLSVLPATVVSVATLLEVPGAALLALVFLGQRPPALAVPGIVLLLAGVAVVVLTTRAARPQPSPPL